MNKKTMRLRMKRPRSRRAIMARVGRLFLILGIISLATAAAIAVFSAFGPLSARAKQRTLSAWYLGGGGLLVALYAAMKTIQHALSTGRRPRLFSRKPRARRQTFDNKRHASSGAVLILTLVVVALMAALLTQIQFSARAVRRQAESSLRRDRLRQAATSAILDATTRLTQADPSATSTNVLWKASWEWEDPTGISTRVRVLDENRFFDLNNLAVAVTNKALRAPSEILMDVMTLCGDFTPVIRVEALLDWIDEDADGPYEEPLYEAMDLDYGPANRLLYGLAELLWVHEFSPKTFTRDAYATPQDAFRGTLTDCVTILPELREQPIPININTAPRPVLQAVFSLAEYEVVDSILAMRIEAPITRVEKVTTLLDPETARQVAPYLDVISRHYRIYARAYEEGVAVDVRALVKRDQTGRVDIMQWML